MIDDYLGKGWKMVKDGLNKTFEVEKLNMIQIDDRLLVREGKIIYENQGGLGKGLDPEGRE